MLFAVRSTVTRATATLTMVLLCAQTITPTLATASPESDAGRDVCGTIDRSGRSEKEKSIYGKCDEARMQGKAYEADRLSLLMYSTLFLVCMSECTIGAASPTSAYGTGSICTVLGLATDLGDAGLAMALKGEGNSVLGQMAGTLMMKGLLGYDSLDKLGKIMDGEKVAAKKTKEHVMCYLQAGMAGVQAYMRKKNMAADRRSEDAAYTEAGRIASVRDQVTVGGGGGHGSGQTTNTGASGTISEPGMKSGVVASTAPADNNLVTSAATAGFAPAFQKFNELTGKTPKDLLDRIDAGQPPLMAAAEMGSTSLGPEGAKATAAMAHAIASNADALTSAPDVNKYAGKMGDFAFQATGSSGGAGGAADAAMPDFGALMAGLMPGAGEGEKKPQGAARALRLGTKAEVTPEGFHAPARSLFDIVDARYQLVVPRFTAGDNIMSAPRTPASVPENLYLKR